MPCLQHQLERKHMPYIPDAQNILWGLAVTGILIGVSYIAEAFNKLDRENKRLRWEEQERMMREKERVNGRDVYGEIDMEIRRKYPR